MDQVSLLEDPYDDRNQVAGNRWEESMLILAFSVVIYSRIVLVMCSTHSLSWLIKSEMKFMTNYGNMSTEASNWLSTILPPWFVPWSSLREPIAEDKNPLKYEFSMEIWFIESWEETSLPVLDDRLLGLQEGVVCSPEGCHPKTM